MATTIRSLLATPRFDLSRIAGGDDDLDRPISWVHSSDLLDPTPWLESDQLLLTDGAQFAPDVDTVDAAAYCERLHARGVVGLGFAVDVIHSEIPRAIVAACARLSMPLLRVPAATPFIGIIRHVADIVADERSAQLAWSLEAQRAVARAAVRKGGLADILRTLSQRLGTWVALYDSIGARVRIPGVPSLPKGWEGEVGATVQRMLERGSPALRRTDAPHSASLHTIGQARRLRGVLVVGSAGPMRAAESDLVETVIALASVTLEQQRAVDGARGQVRSGILELLEAGAVEAAQRAAKAVGRLLPRPPVRVILVRGPFTGQSVLDELEIVSARGGDIFFAERGQDVIVIVGAEAVTDLAPVVERHLLSAGVSSAVDWNELGRGISEARHAAVAERELGLVRFEDRAAGGVRAALLRGGGALVARRLLDPLSSLPADDSARLLAAAAAWFAANTAWDPAARELGIHRHTLRARLDRLGQVTGLDLDAFEGRAELWAALELVEDDGE